LLFPRALSCPNGKLKRESRKIMLKYLFISLAMSIIAFTLMYLMVLKLTKKKKIDKGLTFIKVFFELLLAISMDTAPLFELYDEQDKDNKKISGGKISKKIKTILITITSYLLLVVFVLGLFGVIYYIKELF